jgi:hypothetical protein
VAELSPGPVEPSGESPALVIVPSAEDVPEQPPRTPVDLAPLGNEEPTEQMAPVSLDEGEPS